MDHQYEQRLRDEVIYLHSLWHQGPPKSSTAAAATHHHLQPKISTPFKKEKKTKKKNPEIPAPEPISSQWPSPASPPPPTTTAWSEFPKHSSSSSSSLSPKEKSKLVPKNPQVHAFKAVREFFKCKNGDDSDGVDSSDDDDDDELMEEDYGQDDYSFFLKLLMEGDEGLKENYEKNFAEGEFSCLVCGALRRGKKFRGCLGLVQHTKTIAKTKKRKAHRAFGQAVCKVLGWDIDQLPAVDSWLSELKSGELQGNGNGVNGGVLPVTVDIASTKNDEGDIGNGNGDNGGVLPVTGDIASTKNDEGDVGNVNSDVNNVDSIAEYNGVIPGIGAAVSPSLNAVQGDTNNVNMCVNNVDSVEGNKVVPGTGAIDSCVRVEGNVEDFSLNANDLDSVVGNNGGVEPESAAITSSDNNGGDMHSWTLPDANKDLEAFGTGHLRDTDVFPAEGFTIVPLDENNVVGNEIQVVLNKLKE